MLMLLLKKEKKSLSALWTSSSTIKAISWKFYCCWKTIVVLTSSCTFCLSAIRGTYKFNKCDVGTWYLRIFDFWKEKKNRKSSDMGIKS